MSAPFWARNRARDALEGENTLERVAEAIYRTYKTGHEHGELAATRGTLTARDKVLFEGRAVALHKILGDYFVLEAKARDGDGSVYHARLDEGEQHWWGHKQQTLEAALIDAIAARQLGAQTDYGEFINRGLELS